MQLKGSKTERNLLSTFAGESRARNKYTFYVEKAKQEGYDYVASIFDATANNEKAHAREVFDWFLKMNKNTTDNLKDAAQGECFESSNLYKQFEKEARAEGFIEIADFYKELQEVEENHEMRFMKIHENLKAGMMFKRNIDVKWQCMNCGYIHIGKVAPELCPLCKFPRSYFKIYCEDYNNMEGNARYNTYTNMNKDIIHDIGERQQKFTLVELSKYNGLGGNPAYVAVNGIVYDVSSVQPWAGGVHFGGVSAGKDLTENFNTCHGASKILDKLPKVGVVTG